MSSVILFNKPFRVLSQFIDSDGRDTLAKFLHGDKYKGYYAAGRLDYDSEGLMVLTNNGALQNQISSPAFKLAKTYWVQVEGLITDDALQMLRHGVPLKDGKTLPAKAKEIPPPSIWQRTPPIRDRKNIPTSWLELTISEGKNRQVRRMTAAVNLPTLRLIRSQIGPWQLASMQPGDHQFSEMQLHTERPNAKKRLSKRRSTRLQNHD